VNTKEHTFSDATIAQIVRLIQLGMLTGTDVSDQLRTMRVIVVDDKISPSPDFVGTFNENLTRMTEQIGDL